MHKLSNPAKNYTHIDVDSAAHLAAVQRDDVVRRLQEWHNIGTIELSPSGVINRFRVLREFPRGEEESARIIDMIYAQIEAREQSDIDGMHAVIDLITSRKLSSPRTCSPFRRRGIHSPLWLCELHFLQHENGSYLPRREENARK